LLRKTRYLASMCPTLKSTTKEQKYSKQQQAISVGSHS
jgi:hypothetical protein